MRIYALSLALLLNACTASGGGLLVPEPPAPPTVTPQTAPAPEGIEPAELPEVVHAQGILVRVSEHALDVRLIRLELGDVLLVDWTTVAPGESAFLGTPAGLIELTWQGEGVQGHEDVVVEDGVVVEIDF